MRRGAGVDACRGSAWWPRDHRGGSHWILVRVLEIVAVPHLLPRAVLGRVDLRERHQHVERGAGQREQPQFFQGPAEATHAGLIPVADFRQHRLAAEHRQPRPQRFQYAGQDRAAASTVNAASGLIGTAVLRRGSQSPFRLVVGARRRGRT